jgi:hypothetical protein
MTAEFGHAGLCPGACLEFVMAGLVPAIHALGPARDGRRLIERRSEEMDQAGARGKARRGRFQTGLETALLHDFRAARGQAMRKIRERAPARYAQLIEAVLQAGVQADEAIRREHATPGLPSARQRSPEEEQRIAAEMDALRREMAAEDGEDAG